MTSLNEFAQKQMKRYGWSEGKGLGRREDGMKNAIKVALKNNKGGLGHDQGAEFTFHWWDHIFDKAASSFKVLENEEGALIEKCEGKKASSLISTKKYISSKFSSKSLLYGTFVKSATYDSNSKKTSGNDSDSCSDESSDDDDDDDKSTLVKNDTLEKTFQRTGLTGHKAARHGFSLNGKLQRLQNQEDKQSSGSAEYTKFTENGANETNNVFNENKTKTKKKKKDKTLGESYSKLTDVMQTDDNDNTMKKKKKKKAKLVEKGVEVVSRLPHVSTSCLDKINNNITDIAFKLKMGKHSLKDTISLLDDQPKKKKKKKQLAGV